MISSHNRQKCWGRGEKKNLLADEHTQILSPLTLMIRQNFQKRTTVKRAWTQQVNEKNKMLNKRCGYEQMVLTASLLVPGSEHVQNGINHKFHLRIPEQDVLHHWIPHQQEMEVAHIAWVVEEKMKMETGLQLSHHLLNSIQFFGCTISFLVYEPFHCGLPRCSTPHPPTHLFPKGARPQQQVEHELRWNSNKRSTRATTSHKC